MSDFDLDDVEARRLDAAEAIDEGDLVMIRRGATARLIREDVPALVAEVRALRAKVERVKKVEREYQQESANDLLTAKTRHYAAAVSQNIRDALRGDGS